MRVRSPSLLTLYIRIGFSERYAGHPSGSPGYAGSPSEQPLSGPRAKLGPSRQ